MKLARNGQEWPILILLNSNVLTEGKLKYFSISLILFHYFPKHEKFQMLFGSIRTLYAMAI